MSLCWSFDVEIFRDCVRLPEPDEDNQAFLVKGQLGPRLPRLANEPAKYMCQEDADAPDSPAECVSNFQFLSTLSTTIRKSCKINGHRIHDRARSDGLMKAAPRQQIARLGGGC